jgi:hypothetical protein
MKYLFAFIFFSVLLFACTGDCLSCHPKLAKNIDTDQRHKPMLTCIECHKPDAQKMADCGADCFACHSMRKIYAAKVKEHDVIQSCRECHMNAADKLFDMSKSINQSQNESLKDFILK